MRSPRPAVFLTICFWSPWPKAPSSVTATVPQMMPKIVRNVRSFWLRTSRSICRRASLKVNIARASSRPSADLLRRPLDHLRALGQSRHHLGVHAVGDADLDLDLFGLGLRRRRRDLDERLLAAVFECDHALGNCQDVFLLPDDDVGVGGIAGPQDDLASRIELDFDVEERGAVLLLGLRCDARDLSGHDVGGKRADLDAGGQADAELAYVDLVDGSL